MPRVVLTSKAESDLGVIFDHYESKIGARRAGQLVSRLLDSLTHLQQFTGLGRASQVPGIRELVFTQVLFIAPYRVIRDNVQVLRLLHQRTQRPEQW